MNFGWVNPGLESGEPWVWLGEHRVGLGKTWDRSGEPWIGKNPGSCEH